MDDAESTMIETLPGRDDDELGKTAVAEVGAAMTCPAAHLDALRPAGITFCSSNSPSEFPSEYPEDSDPTLLPCTICNRTFNPQALERHRKVCEKLSSKRRKTFNSTKQRVDGLDIPPLIPTRGRSPESKAQQAKSKSKWREKHREFLMAIRAAKGMPDDEHGNDGPPAPNIPSDYVQCPQCERHFGPKAADRHIEWCKEKATRMPRSPANTQAAERLKTRTKYAPPKPGQNGWRAPKKSDVISSIPPPSSGPTPTPGGALGAREFSPPSNRQMSPPRSLARQTSPPLHAGRHLSPPPMTSSRRTSISSVASLGRSGSMSLGRSAGKQLSAMLSSGHSSGYGSSASYGTSSGYGQSSKYGQLYGYSQQPHCGSGAGSSLSRGQVGRSSFSGGVLPLVRQGSMRSSLRRTSSSTPMARHRDLTSDMMASVCISPDPKRGEPEGDEAGEILPTCSSSLEATFSKLEDVTYDPFSAAELQMQALMGLSKPPSSKGTGLGPAGLGLGVSMMESVRMEGTGRESPDFDFDMGLEEFEKEYQSTKTQSLGYGSPKLRARKDARSSVSGLGKRSDSLSGLSQEQTAPGCDLELDWSWKDNPSSSSDCWRAGTVSPTFKKSSWGAPRETRNNNQNLLASVSQENISNDAHRWSSARESSRESRSWSSPSRETTWTSLTHDIHNWSASAQGNDSLSLPSRDSPRKSSPAREIRYGSPDPRKSSPAREIRYGSPDPRKSSPAREIRYGSPDPRKSSPAREIRYGSPDRSSHGWISPTRDSQSSTNDTNRFSSPTRDSVSESSVTNDGHSWSSPARDRHSPPHDSFKPFTHDNHTRSSLVKDSQNKDFAMDAQELSLPTQETYSRFSKGHNTYRSSPSRDKENIFSSDRQKEILPSFESQRLSSSLQKSVKDSSFGYDARSWSSPTRERLGDSPSGYSCLSDILDNNKNDSSKFRELSSWKSAAAERQKDSSVDRVSNAERPTQDRCFAMGASFGDRRSLSPARDTDRWGTSAKDEEGVVNTTTSNKSQSSWGAGESSSGLSSLSKHFGGSLINTQQSTALLTTSDEGYKKKSGFETYRATQDSLDSDMNSAKKGTNSGDDSHLRVSSGSSSDSSSLPPLSSPTLATSAPGNHTGEPGSSTSSMKMPRFCHECGHKYPVLLAKFCCHCGSRRASVGN
ncbi:serine-rich adhesin for platelets-like isoform X10 [Macrobrachium rosenbergii]|uniref:serine-rich adhesin for platelets-like isoform X10 n=1 Tax=Macrobrachium rosenbergii TaxID=79674 RepID=UPI0034D6240E